MGKENPESNTEKDPLRDVIIIGVDDDGQMRYYLNELLALEGAECNIFSSLQEAEKEIGKRMPDIILLDMRSDGKLTGLEDAKRLEERYGLGNRVILMSVFDYREEAERAGYPFVAKGEIEELVNQIQITYALLDKRS